MDRIDGVAVFAEVAERGSFAQAARRLHRSPAAVTRAVAELEARLGVRLLNRTTRAVSLTEAGERFLSGARRVLADLAEIEQAAAGQGHAARGELRVTAPIVFGRRHVLPLVTDFLAQYPEVSVRLALLDRPVDLVEEGLDVAIRIGALADTSAIATRIGAVRRLVVAAPAYLKRHGRPNLPADLAAHDVIAFVGIEGERWRFAGGVETPIKPRLIVNTAEAAIDAARAGFGVTRVLSYQAADALAEKSLLRLLREHEAPETPIHVLYPGGRHPPPKLRAFLDALVPRLRQRCDRIARAIDR
jgi:DNA-binding transcriptional LysR family regulator